MKYAYLWNRTRGGSSGAAAAGLLSVALALGGVAYAARAAPAESAESVPGNLGRASCFDVAAQGGAVYLLLGQPRGESGEGAGFTLYFRRSNDGGRHWSDPTPIPTGHAPPGNHHRGNDPQLAVYGDRVIALWTARGDGPWGSGPIGVALSDDGGRTWRSGPGLSSDAAGYRFPAAAADADAFHAVWIHALGDRRSLRYARLDLDADRWSDPVTIDADSCACCWNELRISPDGDLLALYRDESPRDMGLAASTDRGQSWRRLGHVGRFDWRFDGCPHVGGGLAAVGGTVWSTVWTGKPHQTGAYALRSTDGGRSWSTVMELGTRGGRGTHTDVAAASAARAAVAWDQLTPAGSAPAAGHDRGHGHAGGGDTQAVFIAFTADAGQTWSTPRRLSPAGRRAAYPRLVRCGDRYLVLWSEYAKGQTPRLCFAAFDAP